MGNKLSAAGTIAVVCGVAMLVGGAVTTARAGDLKGEVKVDGSSTVYLITEAVAAAFKKEHPDVRITVGISGTGGGFKKFSAGETDISDASRPIKPAEVEACRKNGIDFIELQVGWDGLSVVINPENTWARQLTVAQLHKIWQPNSKVKRWSDVDPSWPDQPVKLFGPGSDSGTFDFFCEAINGKEKAHRTDYTPSEDDNVVVSGVAGNKYAMGYFGLAYYEENKDKLQLAAIAAKEGGPFVQPSEKTVVNKTYKPLSRPLFVYVKKSSLKRPEIQQFVSFYLRRYDLVTQAKYIKTNTRVRNEQVDKLENALKDVGN